MRKQRQADGRKGQGRKNGPTKVTLQPTSKGDRNLAMHAVGWATTPALKQAMLDNVRKLSEVGNTLVDAGMQTQIHEVTKQGSDILRDAVRIVVLMEAQNQRDRHHEATLETVATTVRDVKQAAAAAMESALSGDPAALEAARALALRVATSIGRQRGDE